MSLISVLYDGWPLAYSPNSPAALHLLAILASRPPGVRPSLIIPAEPPAGLAELQSAAIHIQPKPPTTVARLQWEQRTIPQQAHELKAQLIHLTTPSPPLFPSPPSIVSPTSLVEEQPQGQSAIERMRVSLAQGGMVRARGLFWPADLPLPKTTVPVFRLPPFVHPAYFLQENPPQIPPDDLVLPESYILYHGPTSHRDLHRALKAWTWAAGSIGQLYPLVVLGADSESRKHIQALCAELGLTDQVHVLPSATPKIIPAIYHACTSLFHPAPVEPWGGAVRHALACGKPIVTIDSPLADALVGSAAFLLGKQDSRKLGAALITTVVDQEVAESLSAAATQRSTSWRSETFSEQLSTAYQELVTLRT